MKTLIRSGLFLVCLTGLVAGCGGGKGGLTGKVTFDGKPMTKGQVSLQAPDGTLHAGDISPDGTYKIDAIPSGTVKLAVTYTDDSQTEYFRALAKAGKGDGVAPKAPPKMLYNIPPKFSEFSSSELTAVVKTGVSTTHDIAVTSK
jgi:hypothetical protein